MKTFAILTVFLFAYALADDSNESKSLEEDDIKELAQLVKDKFNTTIIYDLLKLAKKAEEKCPDIEGKIEGAIDQILECITDIELGADTLCSLIRNNWEKCSKPGWDAVASCLPAESKDLPHLFGKVFFALVDQACNSTVEQILELLNPCGLKNNYETFPECKDVLKTFTSHKNELPSKSLVCSMLPKLKNCAEAHDKAGCENPITRQASNQFFEAVEDATKDDCDAINKP
ncbi:uncharacterized protein [Leptinotarsa decemlineata]|uniref:uncharacterized protein n=1 Tax=Leptinotarsa decemlineata TaxID=7539 RepID=UPI003D30A6A5